MTGPLGKSVATIMGVARPSSTRTSELVGRRTSVGSTTSRTDIERRVLSDGDLAVATPSASFGHDNVPGERPRLPDGAADSETRHELLKLVQRLFLPVGTSTEGARVVMFAAPEPIRDAETTSVFAAETLAAFTGRMVCLVDANIRDPFLHRRFTVGNAVGFSDLLAGTHTVPEVSTQIARALWLVPAGPRRSSQEGEPGMRTRAVADLVATFDFVLIAACSLGLDADAIELARSVDGVVLVVDHATTRRDAARRGVDALRAANVRVSGVVLKRRQPSAFGFWRRR